MNDKQLLSLGFIKSEWEDGADTFIEYFYGNSEIGIMISGQLIELVYGRSIYVDIPNCATIKDLKSIINLFNIKL